MSRTLLALVTFALACGSPTAAPATPAAPAAPMDPPLARGALPSESLYNLHPLLVDQHARPVSLDVHRGHPVIVSMFYTSCPNACPLLISDIRALEASLPDDVRANVRVLLVSLDPARDTPEAMAKVVADHQLDDTRWTLARSEPSEVRSIAAALGIRYRPLADGEMNHSSLLTLLDGDGRPVATLEGLGRDATALREAITKANQATPR